MAMWKALTGSAAKGLTKYAAKGHDLTWLHAIYYCAANHISADPFGIT